MGRVVGCVVAVLACVGCGPDSALEWSDGTDDGVELTTSELNSVALLAFVNSARATFTVLNEQVRIDARAAKNIVAARDGADGVFGTADDRPFRSVAELDAVPWVGPSALALLDGFASAGGPPVAASVTVEGVVFTAPESVDALAAVNGAQLTAVGFTSLARDNLLAARPFSTLAQVGAVAQVGPAALTTLRTFAQRNPSTPVTPPPTTGCIGAGGTFDGVSFTAAEDCHAADFLSRARLSEMAALPAFARLLAYQRSPTGGARWTSTAAFANASGIGKTAVTALKASAAAWSPNGAEDDTVSSTWTHRERLVNGPVGLPRVYVTRVLPNDLPGAETDQCIEVRDAPGAANYLIVCTNRYYCPGDVCWPEGANTWTGLHGTLRRTTMSGTGGFRLTNI